MSVQPINNHRPDSRATILTLTAGTLAAVAVFAVSFGLRLVVQPDAADLWGTVGVLVLLTTPALALVTTALEMKSVQRTSAALAVLVLVVLGLATAVALFVPR